MKKTKEGALHFETMPEIHNFFKKEMSSEKIRERAKNRNKVINYYNPRTQHRMIMLAINQLPTRKYREGKILLTTITKCAIERERLVRIANNTKEPAAKYFLIEEAKKLDKSEVYKHYMNEWKYPLKKIKEIEKRTCDAIGDKLEIVNVPITVGETIKQGGI